MPPGTRRAVDPGDPGPRGRTRGLPHVGSRRTGSLVAAALALPLAASDAGAMCNVIPAATQDFRAAIGSANRPFAGPGEYVELRVRPEVCDEVSTGYVDLDQDQIASDDYAVTVIFVPPDPPGPQAAGPPHAVVLAEDCGAVDLPGCEAQLGAGGEAECVPVNGPGDPVGIRVEGPGALQFRFPDTDAALGPPDDDLTFAGPAKLIASRRDRPLQCGLASQRCASLVGVTFAHGVVACIDELYALDGTCRTAAGDVDATFGHFTALPPANDYQAMCAQASGTTCTGAEPKLRFTTDAVGNALVPMDYAGVLLRHNGVPIAQLSRLATDLEAFAGGGQAAALPGDGFLASYSPEGVILPPVFAPLSDPDTASQNPQTILFGSVDASRGVIRIAQRLPVFHECSSGPNAGLRCSADADCAPGGACGSTTCNGGASHGSACLADADCPGGECGIDRFEFRDRFAQGGVGPVTIADTGYAAQIESPVPLEGLIDGDAAFAFVLAEALDDEERNADADASPDDFVVTLRARETGVLQPIGDGNAPGRAVTRVRKGFFRFPAVDTSQDLLAFLESEPAQGDQDLSENGNVFDSVLRVYRLGATSASELSPADPRLTADADPVLDGRSVVISNGLVFFRVPETAVAPQTTVRVNLRTHPGPAEATGGLTFPDSISADGRFVSFETDATASLLPTGLLPGISDTSGAGRDVFVHDRDVDQDGTLDEPGQIATVPVNLNPDGELASCADLIPPPPALECTSAGAFVSMDGRFLAFTSAGNNLTPSLNYDPGYPGCSFSACLADGFVLDLDADGVGGPWYADGALDPGEISIRNVCLNPDQDADANGNCGASDFAPDGRFLLLYSFANDLVSFPIDADFDEDIFVHDLDHETPQVPSAPAMTQISVDPGGLDTNPTSTSGAISRDGRFAAFASDSSDILPGDTNGARDVFLRDRDADGDEVFDEPWPESITTRVSVTTGGSEANAFSGSPDLSWDGSQVAFLSDAIDLVPGDSNATRDVFVHDRSTAETTRVSVSSAGIQGNGSSSASSSISADGRFAAFQSLATNLVASDLNAVEDAFLHDRVTGHTLRVSVDGSPSPVAGNGASNLAIVSADARFVAFSSHATNLVGGDGNGQRDVFVRGPDTSPASVAAADASGDGDLDDRVLHVFSTGPSPQATPLGPASLVRIASGSAAFLLPEAAEGVDRNDDGDLDDAFVQLSVGGAPAQDLDQEATAIALSPQVVAALEPSGASALLRVYDRGQASWSPTIGSAATSVQTSGRLVAFAAAGGPIQIYDADPQDPGLVSFVDDADDPVPAPAAEEFVLAGGLLALRTQETPGNDLNGDQDTLDGVLQVVDLQTSPARLVNTGQAAIPCRFVACDPQRPYRVSQSTVRFLTLEADQGQDLNDDGDQSDLLVQVFNLPTGKTEVVATVLDDRDPDPAETVRSAVESDPLTAVDPLAAPEPDAGQPAPGEQVLVGAGRCVAGSLAACTVGGAACAAAEECYAPAGETAGGCGEDIGQSCFPERPPGEQGCAPEASCVADFVVIGVADADRDEVPDALDNCREAANVAQADGDLDGVGDACDLAHCGNAALESGEACDDGNLLDGDACTRLCRLPACADGLDNDADAATDHPADPDCRAPSDAWETPDCDDGFDNDGDGAIDLADVVCPAGGGAAEDDFDGVADAQDNCLIAANASQLDTNADGYGNICDADWNSPNDGVVGGPDLLEIGRCFGMASDPSCADVDCNGDAVTGGPELLCFGAAFGEAPGPSGLACAGAVPCP